MLCFAFLCLIDQRIKTGSGLDGWIESFRDMTYIVIAILILSHYRLSDLGKYKLFHFIWLAIGIAGGSLFVWKGERLVFFPNDRIVLAVNLLLWGIIILQTGAERFTERRKPDFIRKPFAVVWLLMMGGMCILRRDIYWPEAYLISFGCFYLTEYSEEERKLLIDGMLDGILLSFFLMQGWCFAFRPYDIVRYSGIYENCNHNVVFYLIVLAAVYTRLLYAYTGQRSGKNTLIRLWYWLLAGALLGFIVLTIGRTGYLVAVVLVFTATLMIGRVVTKQRRAFLGSVLKSGGIIVLCFCLMFPAVFGAVRYLPPFFHHPVWFWGEWSEDRVHSWDPWDSEKFVDADELMEMVLKRVGQILKNAEDPNAVAAEEPVIAEAPVAAGESVAAGEPVAAAPAAAEEPQAGAVTAPENDATIPEDPLPERPEGVTDLQWQRYLENLAEGYAIKIEDEKESRSILIRSTIYRYYIHYLNWTGHPGDEQGFQLTPTYWVGHAHNIYLQWGLEFGIPVMILFAVMIWASVAHLVRKFYTTGDVQSAGYLLLLLVPALFGFLEFCWGAGSLPLALIFLTWGRVIGSTK